MPIQTNENPVLLEDCALPELSIGWNLPSPSAINLETTTSSGLPPLAAPMATTSNFLAEVQVSHKQITDRFVDLLNLFEDYSRIMKESEQAQLSPQPRLKRTQSEQFTPTHLQPVEIEMSSDLVKATVSLNRVQLSNSTLLGAPPKLTCEAASQTCWPLQQLLPGDKEKLLKQQQQQQQQQLRATTSPEAHTLHIEVESVSSLTALERAPLRQRLGQVLNETGRSLTACLSMMGENFTYVLFVVLCLWCLYLIIGHYYSFIDNNIKQQPDMKQALQSIRSKPNQVP